MSKVTKKLKPPKGYTAVPGTISFVNLTTGVTEVATIDENGYFHIGLFMGRLIQPDTETMLQEALEDVQASEQEPTLLPVPHIRPERHLRLVERDLSIDVDGTEMPRQP